MEEYLNPNKSTYDSDAILKFIKDIELDKPSQKEYEYMQLTRFLSGSTRRSLESADYIFTSEYTKEVTTKITHDLQRLLMNLYWQNTWKPPKMEEDEESVEDTILKIFSTTPNADFKYD